MRTNPHRPQKLLRTLVLSVVLAAPAAAIAAEPVEDATSSGGKTRATATTDDRDGLLANTFPGTRGPIKKLVEEAGRPVHPVATAVDYGNELNAFGNARGRPHEGQDIFAPAGTKLVAVSDTEVVDGGSDGGRGNWLSLYDPERDQTYNYFHMIAPAVVGTGEKVNAGRKVGELGCTGSCSGEHLHFEIREGRDPYGTAIDPLPFLGKADGAG